MTDRTARLLLWTFIAFTITGLLAVRMVPPVAPDDAAPIAVTLQVQGRFATGSGWTLRAASGGLARLTIETYPKDKARTIAVSRKQFAALKRELRAVRFFELGTEYGDRVPDGSVRELTVTEGAWTKSVSLLYLRENDPRREEVKRALRVWHLVRGWFSDSAAVDLRRYDRRILGAP